MKQQVATLGGFVKQHIKLVILVVAVLVVSGGTYKYVTSRPAAVIGAVKPSFAGYSGSGKVSYNYTQARRTIFKTLLKKNGVSESEAAMIVAGHTPNKYKTDVNLVNKLADTQTQLDSIKITFSKRTALKNGDHITLKLKAPADLPVQSATKEIKVSGLKPTTAYTAKQAMGKNTPRFLGVNGFGQVKDSTRRSDRFEGGDASDSYFLKNGDKVTYRLDSDYTRTQREHGRRLKGTAKLTYTVNGLPELADVADWKQLASYADSYAHAVNSGGDAITYKLEPLKCYAVFADRETALQDFTFATPDVIDEAPKDALFMTYAVIYRRTEHTVDAKLNVPDKITYPAYGRETVPFYDGKLHTEHIDDTKWHQGERNSETDAIAKFKSDHAHAVEVKLS